MDNVNLDYTMQNNDVTEKVERGDLQNLTPSRAVDSMKRTQMGAVKIGMMVNILNGTVNITITRAS